MRNNKIDPLSRGFFTIFAWYLRKSSINRKIARYCHHVVKLRDEEKWDVLCRNMHLDRADTANLKLIGGIAVFVIAVLYLISLHAQTPKRKGFLVPSIDQMNMVLSYISTCILMGITNPNNHSDRLFPQQKIARNRSIKQIMSNKDMK
jgi:hypothetical protein